MEEAVFKGGTSLSKCHHVISRFSEDIDIGFVSNIIENHDEPRGVSRYIPEGDCCDASKKMLGGLNFMLRGLPFIYQGQELGMENVKFESIDQVDDISSLDEYKVALEAGCTPEEALKAVSRFSRDNARTPMQWTDGENAGFTTGKPWLKVNANYTKINAESPVSYTHLTLPTNSRV